jgi:hypothetical protein
VTHLPSRTNYGPKFIACFDREKRFTAGWEMTIEYSSANDSFMARRTSPCTENKYIPSFFWLVTRRPWSDSNACAYVTRFLYIKEAFSTPDNAVYSFREVTYSSTPIQSQSARRATTFLHTLQFMPRLRQRDQSRYPSYWTYSYYCLPSSPPHSR